MFEQICNIIILWINGRYWHVLQDSWIIFIYLFSAENVKANLQYTYEWIKDGYWLIYGYCLFFVQIKMHSLNILDWNLNYAFYVCFVDGKLITVSSLQYFLEWNFLLWCASEEISF